MTAHTACVLTIGDELLNGDVVNTNASWLGQILRRIGIPCRTMLTVSDKPDQILQALKQAWQAHDLIIITGGLGPTRDDVTKKVLLSFFEDKLVRNERVLEMVTNYFERKNRPITEINREQADVPSTAIVLENELGTAPGLFFEQQDRLLAAMPGVPYELYHITQNRLIPEIERRWHSSERRVQQRYLRLTGIGESDLSDRILVGLEDRIPQNVDLAFLPHPKGVDVRVTEVNGLTDNGFDGLVDWIHRTAAEYVYSERYDESLAHHLVSLLSESRQTLAVAESCTGGYLANAVTDIPGSSACFRGGVVAYDNRIKVTFLGVGEAALEKHGAVSAQVALEMAHGVGERMDADFGISTTGIAGPDGGTGDKPVGTVWIGFWAREGTHFACRYQLTSERLVNKERSFAVAMDLLRRHIRQIPGIPHHPEIVRS